LGGAIFSIGDNKQGLLLKSYIHGLESFQKLTKW